MISMAKFGSSLQAVTCVPLLAIFLLATASASDWTQWRGSLYDGIGAASEAIETSQNIAFKLAFEAELGSGYSSISLKDGLAVTMATMGDGDFVVAFNAHNGEQVWRYRMEDYFLGENGADDGPISTPTIDGDRVYALSARGKLFALNLKSGKLLWSSDLDATYGGQPPGYGYSTVPIASPKSVLVAVGGTENRTLVALDRDRGTTLWTVGIEDKIGYHNPALLQLRGKLQCVVPTYTHVMGVDPENGTLLWQEKLEGRHVDTQVIPVGKNAFALASYRNLQLFELTDEAGSLKLKRQWKSLGIKSNHGAPIYKDGYFYGFSGTFLACVNGEDGKAVWKSREPGGQNLMAMGRSLVFWDKAGHLVAVKISPEAFQMQGRLKLSKQARIFTPPSFAHGRVYLRDLNRLYAVDVKPSRTGLEKKKATQKPLGIMAKLHTDLAQGEANEVIAAFKKAHPTWPIADRNGWVHFIFEGDVDDIAIVGDMTGGIDQNALQPIAGTQLHFRTYTMKPGSRWQYRFAQFEDLDTDPKNPNTIETPNGKMSVYAHSDWRGFEAKTNLSADQRGTLIPLSIDDPDSETDLTLKVYWPTGHEQQGDPLPLLMIAKGEHALEFGKFDAVLNARAQQGKPAIAVVFLTFPEHYWYSRHAEKTSKLLKELVVPELEKRFSLAKSRNQRGLLGHDWSAPILMRFLLKNQDSFGAIGFQSGAFGETFQRNYLDPNLEKMAKTRLVFRWAAYDQFTPAYPLFTDKENMALVDLFKKHGHQTLGKEHAGGHNWVSWQADFAQLLQDLFPDLP